MAIEYYASVSEAIRNDSAAYQAFLMDTEGLANYIELNSPGLIDPANIDNYIRNCSLLVGYADFHGRFRWVEYADPDNVLHLDDSPFTLEAWVYVKKLNYPSPQVEGTIFSRNEHIGQYETIGFTFGYYHTFLNAEGPIFTFNGIRNYLGGYSSTGISIGSSSLPSGIVTTPAKYNKWHHVAIRKLNDTLESFLDGNLYMTLKLRPEQIMIASRSNLAFRVGSSSHIINVPPPFAGSRMRNIRMWKRALNHAEIRQIGSDSCTFKTQTSLSGLVFWVPLLDPFETNPDVAFTDVSSYARTPYFGTVTQPMGSIFQYPVVKPSLDVAAAYSCPGCCNPPIVHDVATWLNRDGPSKYPIYTIQNAVICPTDE